MPKALEEKDGDHASNTHAKLGHVGMNTVTRNTPLVEPFSSNSQSLATGSEHRHDGKSLHSLTSLVGFSNKKKKKTYDPNICSKHSLYTGISNMHASVFLMKQNDTEKQMSGVLKSGNQGKNVKDTREFSEAMHQKYQANSAPNQILPQCKRLMSETINVDSHGNKNERPKLPDLNIPHYPMQPVVSDIY